MLVAQDMIHILDMMAPKKTPTMPAKRTSDIATQTDDWRMCNLSTKQAPDQKNLHIKGRKGKDVTTGQKPNRENFPQKPSVAPTVKPAGRKQRGRMRAHRNS